MPPAVQERAREQTVVHTFSLSSKSRVARAQFGWLSGHPPSTEQNIPRTYFRSAGLSRGISPSSPTIRHPAATPPTSQNGNSPSYCGRPGDTPSCCDWFLGWIVVSKVESCRAVVLLRLSVRPPRCRGPVPPEEKKVANLGGFYAGRLPQDAPHTVPSPVISTHSRSPAPYTSSPSHLHRPHHPQPLRPHAFRPCTPSGSCTSHAASRRHKLPSSDRRAREVNARTLKTYAADPARI